MLKKHLSTFLFTILMLTLLLGGLFFVFNFGRYSTKGIEFTVEKNIDDKYGKLDSNTKIILEKELTKAMEEKKVEYFFSYVYEDLNESYTKSLNSRDSIFIYYNVNSEKLATLSNLEITDYGLTKTSISSDKLSDIFPKYIDTVNKGIQEDTNYIPTKNLILIQIIFLLIFAIFLFSFLGLIPRYIENLKIYSNQLKNNAKTRQELKALKQKSLKDLDNLNTPDTSSKTAKTPKPSKSSKSATSK